MTLQPFQSRESLNQAKELAQTIPGCNPLDANDLGQVLQMVAGLRTSLRADQADVEDCLCGVAERIVTLIERHGHISGRQALSLVVEILGQISAILTEQVEADPSEVVQPAMPAEAEKAARAEPENKSVTGEASRLGLRLMDNRKLGEILVSLSMLKQNQVERALKHQKANGKRFGETLIELGFINKAAIDSALRIQRKNHDDKHVDPWKS